MADQLRLSAGRARRCVRAVVLVGIALSCTATAVAQTFSKTANPPTGVKPLTVVYTYTFDNTNGPRVLSVEPPDDDKCSPVTFKGGDTNGSRTVDIGEVWTWTCTTTLTATTSNEASMNVKEFSCGPNSCSTGFVDFVTARATVILPELAVSIIGSTSVCKNSVVTLTAAATGGNPPYKYLWSNGATTQAITPSTANSGTFPFSVTVTDSAGASVTESLTLTVAAVCLTEVRSPGTPPQFPLLTTIEWRCGFSFAGRCFSQTIDKICIGGHCLPNPNSPEPPLCPRCDQGAGVAVGGALGVGAALGLIAGLLLRARRGPSSPSTSGPRPT